MLVEKASIEIISVDDKNNLLNLNISNTSKVAGIEFDIGGLVPIKNIDNSVQGDRSTEPVGYGSPQKRSKVLRGGWLVKSTFTKVPKYKGNGIRIVGICMDGKSYIPPGSNFLFSIKYKECNDPCIIPGDKSQIIISSPEGLPFTDVGASCFDENKLDDIRYNVHKYSYKRPKKLRR